LTQPGTPGSTGCAASVETGCQITSGTGGQFTSQLVTGSQQDWVRFVPTVTGTYTIRSSTIPLSHDVYGTLHGYHYGDPGAKLTSNDDSGGNRDFLITRELTAGQAYYIAIRNYATTTTIQPTYTITINQQP
jgi:hypothetical protein